ncbi:DUF1641 domain-containing protein [Lysinibacillus telephonicus]|uniref:DUF1641 domain-containing protein n=1 Tax=Lysinibacillus telephonicus TaxID=1714840 RepID=A0A431USJ2_9BACI|nr:DUF1641 domain-containing protein [Lysinibacillus telephonicus]RTQ93422.1 DUF1641 domain-containing protein [Lysinibacillus telephonicus]
MAEAIKQIRKEIPTPEQEQSQAIADIIAALASNREAIISTIGIIKHLQDMGVLDALNGLLEKRVDVGAIAIQQINQPGMHNMIKNGMNTIKFLGQLNPDELQIMLDGVSRGLEKLGERIDKNEKVSLWQLGNSVRNEEVRTSLFTMLGLLEGMGEVFQRDKRELH